MICLEVWVNGKKVCLAGVGESDVLNTIIDVYTKVQLANLHVGGLVDDEHVRWVKQHRLQVGDEVTIKIVESDTVDEPIIRFPRKKELQD